MWGWYGSAFTSIAAPHTGQATPSILSFSLPTLADPVSSDPEPLTFFRSRCSTPSNQIPRQAVQRSTVIPENTTASIGELHLGQFIGGISGRTGYEVRVKG